MLSNAKIELIINDPCSSFWLKAALETALKRDPVDAANDAELLYEILSKRCDAIQVLPT